MKGILEFDLPEDECNFKIASTAMDWALTILEMDRWLRDKLKHGHEFKNTDEALQFMRDYLNSELAGRNLNLDMIE
jgi:hypothetical protein